MLRGFLDYGIFKFRVIDHLISWVITHLLLHGHLSSELIYSGHYLIRWHVLQVFLAGAYVGDLLVQVELLDFHYLIHHILLLSFAEVVDLVNGKMREGWRDKETEGLGLVDEIWSNLWQVNIFELFWEDVLELGVDWWANHFSNE